VKTTDRERARVHAIVHGDVQGVGFRYFVQRCAWQEELAGWVRNRPDGAVECVVQGPREAIQRLLAALREGPAMATVDRVEERWEPARPGLEEFDVVG
jgi:acylphosphatase